MVLFRSVAMADPQPAGCAVMTAAPMCYSRPTRKGADRHLRVGAGMTHLTSKIGHWQAMPTL
jgi:hypothetical protein